MNEKYILEVSWGCPTEKYPIHGVFQFDQALALHEAGESVVFLALDLRSVRRWRKWGVSKRTYKGIPVFEYSFPCGPMPPNIKYPIQDHGFDRAIRAITAEYGQPSVIHIHTCQQAISAVEYCKENSIPYVITEHITPLDEGHAIEERKRGALHGAAQVIAVSNALGRDLKKAYDADSVTIPNIVDLSEFKFVAPDPEQIQTHSFSLAERNASGPRIINILSAASMNRGKGFDILISAFAGLLKTHPDTRLTIMGDGPEKENIIKLAAELGIAGRQDTPGNSVPDPDETGMVTFTGTYIRSEFAGRLADSDIFVLPSRSETFGLVYAEALAAGVPVVSTRCGGPEDFIDDSNGILVDVDDVDALAEAMGTMIDNLDQYDRSLISADCRKRFSPETTANQLKQVLK